MTVQSAAGQALQLLCGEDAALAAARIATHRKTGSTHGEEVLATARKFQEALDEESVSGNIGYQPPPLLDAGTAEERPRVLKSGGLYSRRAVSHAKQEQFKEAVADLLRALLRPGIDETARDKLMSTMVDFLKKSEKKRASQAQDGDLSELFEALDLEDDGKDNGDIDRAKLKKVYRELSVKYHPDKNPESAAHFNKIRDAYEILNDPVKVLLFDTGGQELVRKYEGESQELERTEPSEMSITVSLADVYSGSARTVSVQRRVVCRSCRLHPGLPRCAQCRQCPGEKQQRQVWIDSNRYMMQEYEVPSEEKCTTQREELTVPIERGMLSGERVKHPGMASQLPKKIPGDLDVRVVVKPHPLFKRIANDLEVTVNVSLYEALMGFEREIEHLDGRLLRLSVPRGQIVRPGSGMEVQGMGMPLREDAGAFGRLRVRFGVDFPEGRHRPEDLAALEAALRALGQGPRPARLGPTGGGGPKRGARGGSGEL